MQGLTLVWAALWRAEAVHLGLFVVAPLLLGLLKLLLGIVFLPLLLVGFGDTDLGTRDSHLREAGCWIALAPCSIADASLIEFPARTVAAPDSQANPTPREPFAEWPSAVTLRHLWFAAWLSWFVFHLVARERRRRDTA
jgi:hypothetical protein